MRTLLFAAALLVTSCEEVATGPDNAADANGAATQAAAPVIAAASAAKAVSLDDKTALLEWHLGYPAEVSAISGLEKMVREPALKKKAELLSEARDDKANRQKEGYPFNGYESSINYEVAGNSSRLLSLSADWFEFTGGAHPNHGTNGLLWDKADNRAIAVVDMFTNGGAALQTLFGSVYCKALDKERAKRREGESMAGGPDDPFNACPKFSELKIIPQSQRSSGTFSTILFHADPYVAGPYVEGDYDVTLPVTGAVLAALKPQYRASFAVQRQ